MKWLVALAILLSGCCLDSVRGSAAAISGGAGAPSSGGTSSGGMSSTGGTPLDRCQGVYCAANYTCDPLDGACKCGGQLCDTGNCDPGTEACLPGCDGGAGALAVRVAGAGAANADELPIAFVGEVYQVKLEVICASSPYQMQAIGPEVDWQKLGLSFYPLQGEIEGVPMEASDGGPFVLQMEVKSSDGQTAFGNFLLTVK